VLCIILLYLYSKILWQDWENPILLNLKKMLKNKRPTWCHLLIYFTSYVLNMFRALIYPSSGACDYSVELPHWSYCSWLDVCWSFGVAGLEWYPCCRLKLATHKKWNKITSDIKLVFYSSTIAMMLGPTNIRLKKVINFPICTSK